MPCTHDCATLLQHQWVDSDSHRPGIGSGHNLCHGYTLEKKKSNICGLTVFAPLRDAQSALESNGATTSLDESRERHPFRFTGCHSLAPTSTKQCIAAVGLTSGENQKTEKPKTTFAQTAKACLPQFVGCRLRFFIWPLLFKVTF